MEEKMEEKFKRGELTIRGKMEKKTKRWRDLEKENRKKGNEKYGKKNFLKK
jgi:hypothetical protein